MKTTIKHVPSGQVFCNRKEAKQQMGHANYNRAVHKNEILVVSTFLPNSIII